MADSVYVVKNPKKDTLHFSVAGESFVCKPGDNVFEPKGGASNHAEIAKQAATQLSSHGVVMEERKAKVKSAAKPTGRAAKATKGTKGKK